MCNERERLIGYVYDECDARERAAVQQHLDSCAECRTEIAALRSVRADLQTWDVPDHESVWSPFAPAPAPAWWQQVPRWALAAAAGLVIMSGAAGGAMSYLVLNQQTVHAEPAGVQVASGVTVNDMNALEQRMRTEMKMQVDRLNSQVQLVSSRPVPMSAELEAALHKTFDKQLADLRAISDQQLDVINGINNNLGQLRLTFDTRHELLKTRVGNLTAVLEQGR